MRSRFLIFIAIIQSILFLVHWFVYATWLSFWTGHGAIGVSKPGAVMALLAISFVGSSILAFRYSHLLVRVLYSLAAAWLGFISFCFLAACVCWAIYGIASLLGIGINRHILVVALFSMAAGLSLYGMLNASWLRVKRVQVKLENLPESWRGRVAALVSDTHVGPVRNYGFARRLVGLLKRLQPEIIFIAGDFYDGTAVDINRLASAWKEIAPPFGSYFVAGNHEQFSDPERYLPAITGAGVRVLNNEKLEIDGLQLIGVHYLDLAHAHRFRSILEKAAMQPDRASILLAHAPHHLQIAEQAGISLQLSGHTHGGQFFPFTWIIWRVWGPFAYGLKRFGKLLVYTTCGAGTWGPPLRVGTRPEVVLIHFE